MIYNRYTRLLSLSLLSVAAFVFSEWLFFITKPSFFNDATLIQKAISFWQVNALLSLILVVMVSLCCLPVLLAKLFRAPATIIYKIALLIPSFLVACLTILLVDNFSYTLFQYGIVNLPQYTYPFYWLIFVIAFYRTHKSYTHFVLTQSLPAIVRAGLYVVIAAQTLSVIQAVQQSKSDIGHFVKQVIDLELPHVIALSSDGISSKYLSLYGFEKETTPFLKSIEDSLYIFDNHLPNCMNTHCSFASIYSGKLTTTHKIHHNMEYFNGKAAKEHLPGILRQHGYQTYHIELGSVGGPAKLNLQGGFDHIYLPEVDKDRKSEQTGLTLFKKRPRSQFFLQAVYQRLSERLFQIVFYREMKDEFGALTARKTLRSLSKKPLVSRDRTSIEMIKSILKEASRPVFIQTHLVGTHGPVYYPEHPLFSRGLEKTPEHEDEYYFDSLRDFDNYVKEVIQTAKNTGNKSIVVIYSDHGRHSATEPRGQQRIPLMFYLPKGQKGRVEANVHVVDIAPTILDLLDIEIPKWMDGVSLIQSENLRKDRLLMSTYSRTPVGEEQDKPIEKRMYTFTVFVCDTMHDLRIPDLEYYKVSKLESYPTSCDDVVQPTKEQVRRMFLDIVLEHKYDIRLLASESAIKRFCKEDNKLPQEICRAYK